MATRALKQLLLALAFVSVSLSAEPLLLTSGQWARETPPGAPTSAAYMTIENPSSGPVTVTAVRTPAAQSAEMHEVSMENDVMKMHKLDMLEIPAGESFQFKPGGAHIMLIGLNAPLKDGEQIDLELILEGQGSMLINMPVKSQ